MGGQKAPEPACPADLVPSTQIPRHILGDYAHVSRDRTHGRAGAAIFSIK